MTTLRFKPSKISRSSGTWKDEEYDVFADGKLVGRIYEDASGSAPPELRWGSWDGRDARGGEDEVSGSLGEGGRSIRDFDRRHTEHVWRPQAARHRGGRTPEAQAPAPRCRREGLADWRDDRG